jgi:four helix bundle protein
MKTTSFTELEVWKDSRKLNLELYKTLKKRNHGKFSFFEQHILKTSGSVMDNITEGYGRGGNPEFIIFSYIPKGHQPN